MTDRLQRLFPQGDPARVVAQPPVGADTEHVVAAPGLHLEDLLEGFRLQQPRSVEFAAVRQRPVHPGQRAGGEDPVPSRHHRVVRGGAAGQLVEPVGHARLSDATQPGQPRQHGAGDRPRRGGRVQPGEDPGDPVPLVLRHVEPEFAQTERAGDLLLDQLGEGQAGHPDGDLGDEVAVGDGVIAGAGEPPRVRHGGRQRGRHRIGVEQPEASRDEAPRAVQTGAVGHQFPDGDGFLSGGPELGPVRRDGFVVVDEPALGEPVQHGARDALARGERQRDGVVGPPLVPGRPARPDVEHRLAVQVRRERPAAVPGVAEHLEEAVGDRQEAGVDDHLGPGVLAVHPPGRSGIGTHHATPTAVSNSDRDRSVRGINVAMSGIASPPATYPKPIRSAYEHTVTLRAIPS